MVACAPGIVPYLISKKYDRRKCLQLAIIFNLPRIIILTILGIIIGVLAYYLTHEILLDTLSPIVLNVQLLGYGILGVFILTFGGYMFVTSVEKREDLKDGKLAKGCKSQDKDEENENTVCKPEKQKVRDSLQKRFKKLQDKPKRLFFIWGGILSIACMGEIIAVELSVISGSLGAASSSWINAAVLGGAGMFLFTIGAAIPIIFVSVLSSSLQKYVRTIEKLEAIRTIGAMILIMIGLVFIIIAISSLFS
jgi:cytochrome c biogenesis protein CcdA